VTFIRDASAWNAHKTTLDNIDSHGDGSPYKCRHKGSPPEYPCLVRSHFWDDPNGPYTYDHTFMTRADVEALLAKFDPDSEKP
jgi:hypothetical protein